MSTYNWEAGEIVIPTAQYRQFRKTTMEAYNDWQMRLFRLAKEAHAYIKANKQRGIRPFAPLGTFDSWLQQKSGLHESEGYEIEQLICDKANDSKLQAPKKNALDLRKTSKGGVLHSDMAAIVLNDGKHTVGYSVNSNNHAVESARSHTLARKLFRLLDAVRWTRGSGGIIVGNDEYNQESKEEGAGANYPTAEWGPKVKKGMPISAW